MDHCAIPAHSELVSFSSNLCIVTRKSKYFKQIIMPIKNSSEYGLEQNVNYEFIITTLMELLSRLKSKQPSKVHQFINPGKLINIFLSK